MYPQPLQLKPHPRGKQQQQQQPRQLQQQQQQQQPASSRSSCSNGGQYGTQSHRDALRPKCIGRPMAANARGCFVELARDGLREAHPQQRPRPGGLGMLCQAPWGLAAGGSERPPFTRELTGHLAGPRGGGRHLEGGATKPLHFGGDHSGPLHYRVGESGWQPSGLEGQRGGRSDGSPPQIHVCSCRTSGV